jgi:hypothetical protein
LRCFGGQIVGAGGKKLSFHKLDPMSFPPDLVKVAGRRHVEEMMKEQVKVKYASSWCWWAFRASHSTGVIGKLA